MNLNGNERVVAVAAGRVHRRTLYGRRSLPLCILRCLPAPTRHSLSQQPTKMMRCGTLGAMSVLASLMLLLLVKDVQPLPIWFLGRSIQRGWPCDTVPASPIASESLLVHVLSPTADRRIALTVSNATKGLVKNACLGETISIGVSFGSEPVPGKNTTRRAARHMFMTTSLGSFRSHGRKKSWLAGAGYSGAEYADKGCPSRIAFPQQAPSFNEKLVLPCKLPAGNNSTSLLLRVFAARDGCYEDCDSTIGWTQLQLRLRRSCKGLCNA